MTVRTALVLVTLTVLALLMVPVGAMADTSGDLVELSGTVRNAHYNAPIEGAYVVVTGSTGHTASMATGEDGDFSFELPLGTYSLTVMYRDSVLENATGIVIAGAPKVHDVLVSFSLVEDVGLTLRVKVDDERADGARVVLRGVDSCYRNETFTGGDGRLVAQVPSGRLEVEVYDRNDDRVGTRTVGPFVGPGQAWANVSLETGDVEMTWDEFFRQLEDNWPDLVYLAVLVVVLLFIYVFYSAKVDRWLRTHEDRVAQTKLDLLRFASKALYGVGALIALLGGIWLLWELDYIPVTSELRTWANVLAVVVVLYVIGRSLRLLLDHGVHLLQTRASRGKPPLPEGALFMVQGLFRYAILLVFLILILLTILAGLGLRDTIVDGVVGFLDENTGRLTLIVLLIIFLWATLRFLDAFFDQLKRTRKKYSPEMLTIASAVARAGTAFVFTLIIIFTLLSMAGLEETGTFIIIILTTMVGMVVAMAATGSIGNVLSGLVLQSTQPYEKGDRVQVGEEILGDVEEVGLFYTRVRTLNNETIDIPNNIVLSHELVNLSAGKVVAIEVDVSIGYDIPAERVLDLLKMGARSTQGICHSPKPQAFVHDFLDYAVRYKLRAYTTQPKLMPVHRSHLLTNIQNLFYTSGIEIMTPWQLVQRPDAIPSRDAIIERYMDHMKRRDGPDEDEEEAVSEALARLGEEFEASCKEEEAVEERAEGSK